MGVLLQSLDYGRKKEFYLAIIKLFCKLLTFQVLLNSAI